MRIRKEFVRLEGNRSARLVVIAAEGRFTEGIYFEALRDTLRASNVHVEILNRDDGNSSPENVLAQLQDFKKEYNIEDDDQLWLVVDRDRWTAKSIASVARFCHQDANMNFCLSNPCFELWLLLHLEDVNTYTLETLQALYSNGKRSRWGSTWLKQKVRDLMGSYHESNYDAAALLPNVHLAIDRGARLDTNPNDRWPQGVGTRVYLLAKTIMGIE